ncbi:MAG TPA: MltA domain-containing protein, partial [Candidatus Omnitrophota bacterium]|nr:MltA domain-containing protein [Candidatus Omnitrophota bacterium]
QPASFADLPGWQGDNAGAVLPALLKSCDRLSKLPPDRSVGADGMGGTVADWHAPCSAARRLSAGEHDYVRLFFESWFTPHLVSNRGQAEGLFTGYFEPELPGSRSRSGRFSVPLLGKPRDLVTKEVNGEQVVGRMVGGRFEPYPTRAEIEAGALGDRAKPVVWVDDPVDAHILHIQGSGRIRLEDGSVLRLAVAGHNGHKFVGIGRVMKERGLLTDISMPAIRAWLKANPKQAVALMAENPRYIFYRLLNGEGPIGSEGVPLTPERSLAVDTRYIPLGMPLWLDSVDPSGAPLRRLMVAQDTGSAIKGVVRGDFFWGAGEPAFEKAGRMKSPGRYWVLLPKQRSPRIASAE